MPYIAEERRQSADIVPTSAGELNYAFSKLANEYLSFMGFNYRGINDVLGALEGAKLELYRRVVGPYEDKKIKENGDVYSAYLLG